MRSLKLFLIGFAGVLLSACSFSEMAAKILPDNAERQMEQVIDAVLAKDIEAVKAMGNDEFRALENLEEGFEAIFANIIPGEVLETKLANASVNIQNTLGAESMTTYMAQYELIYEEGTNFYTIVMEKQGDAECCALYSLNLKQFETSPSAASAFSFKGKGVKHFLFLGLAIFVPIFIIITLVKCVRTKGLKRKWLWFIFILIGVYGFVLNWTTGDIIFSLIEKSGDNYKINIINFNILGAGVTKSGPYAPWLIEIGIPLGAIIFWFKSRKLRRETVEVFSKPDEDGS